MLLRRRRGLNHEEFSKECTYIEEEKKENFLHLKRVEKYRPCKCLNPCIYIAFVMGRITNEYTWSGFKIKFGMTKGVRYG